MQGKALDRKLWLYDIASAYPSAMLLLPSMRDGEWKFHGELANDIEQTVPQVNILSTFRLKWKFPRKDATVCPKLLNQRLIPFYPFPYRTKRKAILFPPEGHATNCLPD
jgi:hypothetical protein